MLDSLKTVVMIPVIVIGSVLGYFLIALLWTAIVLAIVSPFFFIAWLTYTLLT